VTSGFTWNVTVQVNVACLDILTGVFMFTEWKEQCGVSTVDILEALPDVSGVLCSSCRVTAPINGKSRQVSEDLDDFFQWKELRAFLDLHKLQLVRVPPDGYCNITTVVHALYGRWLDPNKTAAVNGQILLR
jgi:hypothetical protein